MNHLKLAYYRNLPKLVLLFPKFTELFLLLLYLGMAIPYKYRLFASAEANLIIVVRRQLHLLLRVHRASRATATTRIVSQKNKGTLGTRLWGLFQVRQKKPKKTAVAFNIIVI